MTVFRGPEIRGAAARPGGGKAARARSFRVYCQQHSPGSAGSEVCAQTLGSQNRVDIYSNWHTRGFNNLAFVSQLVVKYSELPVPFPRPIRPRILTSKSKDL